ncbi:MAG: hypothetical protein WBH66_06555 [Rectinemataceae bacterium]
MRVYRSSGRWPSSFIVVGAMLVIAVAWVGVMVSSEYRKPISNRGLGKIQPKPH